MKKIFKFFVMAILFGLSQWATFNSIVGSQGYVFSWSSVCFPVAVLQCGFGWSSLFLIFKYLGSTKSLLFFCLHRLPLVFSARAFAKKELFISVVLPFVCMFLFMMHPEGGKAWLYSLYWLIPMILYFVKNSIISRALTASFVAHAIGSVVWLYAGSISAITWLMLIPVVAIERLLIAGGIVVCNQFCCYLFGLVHGIVNVRIRRDYKVS